MCKINTYAMPTLGILALVCSCTKPTTFNEELVPVTFSYGLSNGNPFVTKSGENELLISLTPTQEITLTLTASNGTTYVVNTGETTELPQGTYQVTYATPTPEGVQNFGNFFFTSVPLIRVNQSVTITKGVTAYNITATYTSSAIIFDSAEVAEVWYNSKAGNHKTILTSSGGGLQVFFCNGDLPDGMYLNFVGTDNYKTASVFIATASNGNANVLIPSNWYFMRLASRSVEAGFTFNLLDWGGGSQLNRD